MTVSYLSRSADDTRRIGALLADSLCGGAVIALTGDLGSGKTACAQGIARALGVAGIVQSPTFVLMNVYPIKCRGLSRFVHVDCYRVGQSEELFAVGLDDYIVDDRAVVVIEWADIVADILPADTIHVACEHRGGDARLITVSTTSSLSLPRRIW